MKENPVTILQRWKEDMITWKLGYRFKGRLHFKKKKLVLDVQDCQVERKKCCIFVDYLKSKRQRFHFIKHS
jgi:hypothetical protein